MNPSANHRYCRAMAVVRPITPVNVGHMELQGDRLFFNTRFCLLNRKLGFVCSEIYSQKGARTVHRLATDIRWWRLEG